MYSGTQLYRHPDITDSSICPDELKAHIFSLKLTRLIQTLDNTDTLACTLGVRMNQVPLYHNFTLPLCVSSLLQEVLNMHLKQLTPIEGLRGKTT